ncbi:hypothetical protein H2248_002066 [Termitomyces sp. 'cryptogamus']|nr:hypothetical protein H2248_002066 [Termitomyces sp. 'cryptogamus']
MYSISSLSYALLLLLSLITPSSSIPVEIRRGTETATSNALTSRESTPRLITHLTPGRVGHVQLQYYSKECRGRGRDTDKHHTIFLEQDNRGWKIAYFTSNPPANVNHNFVKVSEASLDNLVHRMELGRNSGPGAAGTYLALTNNCYLEPSFWTHEPPVVEEVLPGGVRATQEELYQIMSMIHCKCHSLSRM